MANHIFIVAVERQILQPSDPALSPIICRLISPILFVHQFGAQLFLWAVDDRFRPRFFHITTRGQSESVCRGSPASAWSSPTISASGLSDHFGVYAKDWGIVALVKN